MKFFTRIRSIMFNTSFKYCHPIVLRKNCSIRRLSIQKAVNIDFSKVNAINNIHEDRELEHVYNGPEESTSELEEYSDMFQDPDMPITVRNILHTEPIDYLMIKLNNCVSVQEVFDLLSTNELYLRHEHFSQSVLVLWDLQKMFYHVNLMNNTLTNQSNIITDLSENYFRQLSDHSGFKLLLNRIEANCCKYDNNTLAVVLLYLNRIGLGVKTDMAQLLIKKFNETSDNTSISALSRFTSVLFQKGDISSYYYIKDYIPVIFSFIENSRTLDEFKHCTICLNNINKLITDDIMDRYTRILRRHLKSGFLDGSDPKAVLKIVMFLNYPQWRDSNAQIISETVLLMKDKMHLLNSYELLLFFEVFYKIQEPASILNELQRHASRYLAHFEDDAVPLLDVRLRLILGLAVHSSHSQRAHYARIFKQHATYHLNRTSVFQFYKLLIYTRTSDTNVSNRLWNAVVYLLDTDEIFKNNCLLKVCANYLHFAQNIEGYRFYKLETCINKLLQEEVLNGYVMMYPLKVSFISTYIIAFGQNKKILDIIINRLETYKDRLNHNDCLNYTKALHYAKENRNPLLTEDYINRIQNVINYALVNNITDDMDINVNNILMKCCIYSTSSLETHGTIISKLIDKYSGNSLFSTRIVKNLAFSLFCTQSLVPKVIDGIVDYIIEHKDNVLGANVEKVLYLCYHLGFLPKRAPEFFQATTEIILRDQERFTGLSYLQSCLALCYFQSLPNSFIKQIFNTVFLDKLDNELANCYHKDVYPIRVRNLMMQLNRAVCIDCPELNVPWFHQKYMNELRNKASQKNHGNMMQRLIKSYLNKIVPQNEYLQENVITPYGYRINFVLNLDEEDQFIKCEDITDGASFKKYDDTIKLYKY